MFLASITIKINRIGLLEYIGRGRVANFLLSQELKLCFSDTKFTKARYTKKILVFF